MSFNSFSDPFSLPCCFPTNCETDGTWNKCKKLLGVGDQPKWLGEKQPPPYAVISSKIDERDEGDKAPPKPVRR